jgi:hypothetical protein
MDELAEATAGFTGADLKRTLEDGKMLYAFDRASNTPLKRLTGYFLSAAENTRGNKEKYAVAEARANAVRSARPPWFTRVPHDEE